MLLDWFRKPQRTLRHHLPDHQPDRAAADRHHPAEPRRRLPAGRSLRFRRGVELLPEIAGRAGAALPPPRPGIQGAASTSASAAWRFPWAWAPPPWCSSWWPSPTCSTKQIATIYGVAFTAVFFVIFTISERVNRRKLAHKKAGLEEFNLDMQAEVDRRDRARASRLRAGGGSRLQPHGASAERAEKDQPAAARHRGDDRAAGLHRRRRVRTLRAASSSPTTRRNCSRAW